MSVFPHLQTLKVGARLKGKVCVGRNGQYRQFYPEQFYSVAISYIM